VSEAYGVGKSEGACGDVKRLQRAIRVFLNELEGYAQNNIYFYAQSLTLLCVLLIRGKSAYVLQMKMLRFCPTIRASFLLGWALLHKSNFGSVASTPCRGYTKAAVCGRLNSVKRFNMAARRCSSFI
jgi:hypothetical protein